jgi:cold shock CspA family protein
VNTENGTSSGVIKTYNEEHGYGFIVPNGKAPREDDKFFHVTKCVTGYQPVKGDAVTFEEGVGRNDKPCAINVRPSE